MCATCGCATCTSRFDGDTQQGSPDTTFSQFGGTYQLPDTTFSSFNGEKAGEPDKTFSKVEGDAFSQAATAAADPKAVTAVNPQATEKKWYEKAIDTVGNIFAAKSTTVQPMYNSPTGSSTPPEDPNKIPVTVWIVGGVVLVLGIIYFVRKSKA
jgi:hypothetical protein